MSDPTSQCNEKVGQGGEKYSLQNLRNTDYILNCEVLKTNFQSCLRLQVEHEWGRPGNEKDESRGEGCHGKVTIFFR